MKDGDVLPVSSVTVTQYDNDGRFVRSESWKPPKGEQFMLLLLGSRPKVGVDFDPVAALHRLGWTSPEYPTPDLAAVPTPSTSTESPQ